MLQDVFAERGVEILAQARAASVRRDGDGAVVTLADGRTVTGSHALMTVGSVPNTLDLALEKAGYAELRSEQAARRDNGTELQLGIGVSVPSAWRSKPLIVLAGGVLAST